MKLRGGGGSLVVIVGGVVWASEGGEGEGEVDLVSGMRMLWRGGLCVRGKGKGEGGDSRGFAWFIFGWVGFFGFGFRFGFGYVLVVCLFVCGGLGSFVVVMLLNVLNWHDMAWFTLARFSPLLPTSRLSADNMASPSRVEYSTYLPT